MGKEKVNAAEKVKSLMQKIKSREEVEEQVKFETQAANDALEEIRLAKRQLALVLETYVDTTTLIEYAEGCLEKSIKALNAAQEKADSIVTGINNAITNAQNSTVKVEVADKTMEQLNQQNTAAINGFSEALGKHKTAVETVFTAQNESIMKVRKSNEGVYLSTKPFLVMLFGFGMFAIMIVALFVVWILKACGKL